MRIESLSIRAVTVTIFSMIGAVAIVLSILAGEYFKKSAFDAQMNSLSRVIEVASQEMLKEVRNHTFDLGMKMGHNRELIHVIRNIDQKKNKHRLIEILDDPFINGFVGVSDINLEKIRVYGLDLVLMGESRQGINGLEKILDEYLIKNIGRRQGVERLKAMDALWNSSNGPLYSTLVPVGGLRLIGYLEIIVNPVFNLPNIGKITKTPISVYSAAGSPVIIEEDTIENKNFLPIKFILNTSSGQPAFRIVGYEDVDKLNQEMGRTQFVTISGFLLLSLGTLIFALLLFSRFLFIPLRSMIKDMDRMAKGRLDLTINKKGLREFYLLAETFNSMANQVRKRTNDLERLLDLDDSAILCFGNDSEAVYFNRCASSFFNYTGDEIDDLDMADLFVEDIQKLMFELNVNDASKSKLNTQLTCTPKDGKKFRCEAIISSVNVQDEGGYAIVLSPVSENTDNVITENTVSSIGQSGQRIDVIEESLNSLLEMARNNPGLLSSLTNLAESGVQNQEGTNNKARIREQVVSVMLSALACWEHDLSKNKLDLAEESRIWPVYIDKSTPTTRTLDKYLQLDSCPKNPRCQRVIDTAEFVLKQLGDQQTQYKQKLISSLEVLRLIISGV
jgi:HAMP domain-containing protein